MFDPELDGEMLNSAWVGEMQAMRAQVKNTPGNCFGELVHLLGEWKGYLCPWGGGQGVWGKVRVALYH